MVSIVRRDQIRRPMLSVIFLGLPNVRMPSSRRIASRRVASRTVLSFKLPPCDEFLLRRACSQKQQAAESNLKTRIFFILEDDARVPRSIPFINLSRRSIIGSWELVDNTNSLDIRSIKRSKMIRRNSLRFIEDGIPWRKRRWLMATHSDRHRGSTISFHRRPRLIKEDPCALIDAEDFRATRVPREEGKIQDKSPGPWRKWEHPRQRQFSLECSSYYQGPIWLLHGGQRDCRVLSRTVGRIRWSAEKCCRRDAKLSESLLQLLAEHVPLPEYRWRAFTRTTFKGSFVCVDARIKVDNGNLGLAVKYSGFVVCNVAKGIWEMLHATRKLFNLAETEKHGEYIISFYSRHDYHDF